MRTRLAGVHQRLKSGADALGSGESCGDGGVHGPKHPRATPDWMGGTQDPREEEESWGDWVTESLGLGGSMELVAACCYTLLTASGRGPRMPQRVPTPAEDSCDKNGLFHAIHAGWRDSFQEGWRKTAGDTKA